MTSPIHFDANWQPRPWPNEDKQSEYKDQEAESCIEQQKRRKTSDELIRRQRDPYEGRDPNDSTASDS